MHGCHLFVNMKPDLLHCKLTHWRDVGCLVRSVLDFFSPPNISWQVPQANCLRLLLQHSPLLQGAVPLETKQHRYSEAGGIPTHRDTASSEHSRLAAGMCLQAHDTCLRVRHVCVCVDASGVWRKHKVCVCVCVCLRVCVCVCVCVFV